MEMSLLARSHFNVGQWDDPANDELSGAQQESSERPSDADSDLALSI